MPALSAESSYRVRVTRMVRDRLSPAGRLETFTHDPCSHRRACDWVYCLPWSPHIRRVEITVCLEDAPDDD